MEGTIDYRFSTKLWKHKSEGGWHFVTLPKKISCEIRRNLQWQEEGWGRMKVLAIVKDVKWNTSIWFDTKINNHLLPVKSEIRKKLFLKEGDSLTVTILV